MTEWLLLSKSNIHSVEITLIILIFPWAAAAAAKSLQSCPTLCNPIDCSPPGPAVPGILQARTLEWVAISSSKAWKWKVKVKSLSRVWLLATPWTAAYQAPPSMGFSRQEYWSGVPLPSPYQDAIPPLVEKDLFYSIWIKKYTNNKKEVNQVNIHIFLYIIFRKVQFLIDRSLYHMSGRGVLIRYYKKNIYLPLKHFLERKYKM